MQDMTLSMQEWGRQMRQRYQGPMMATDIIIEYDHPQKGEGIILITRRFPPYGISVPGGMAEAMSLPRNAIKEAKEETGLDIMLYDEERPLCSHSNPHRDPRAHIGSETWVARGTGVLKAGDDAKTAEHYTIPELEEAIRTEQFAFPTHKRALEIYLAFRKEREILDNYRAEGRL